jgi:uncharacterized protein
VIEFAQHIHPLLGWLLAATGVIILGVAKSGFGGGVGIIAVPMFALAFGAQRGGAILLPLLLAADVFSVYHHWGGWDKKTLAVLAPGTVFGIFAGAVLLWIIVMGMIWPWEYDWSKWHAKATPAAMVTTAGGGEAAAASAPAKNSAKQKSEDTLNLITGVVSVLYVVLDVVRQRIAPQWTMKADGKSGFVAGTAVGVISTLANAAGPVAAIFLMNQGLARKSFIGTTVIYFFGINALKLIPYTIIPGMIGFESIQTGLWLVAFVPVGTFIGAWLVGRMSDVAFKRIILGIVMITGLQLVVDAFLPVKMMTLIFGR